VKEPAPAKVNLCLFLGPTRPDGRHELVTLFESVSLADELALTVLETGPDQVICPGVEGQNLVSAALASLREAGWAGPPVRIEIDKRIPVAGGLGGGSADAAAALRLASGVEAIADEHLERIARTLGADVPGQLRPGLSLGTGAGEELEPAAPLATHAFVIVPQPFPLATADVYREADRLGLPRGTDELAERRRALAASMTPDAILPDELVVNDLEPASLSLAPRVAEALGEVRAAGAEQTLVCGSGPTVMGIYWGEQAEPRARQGVGRLSGKYPEAVFATPTRPSQYGAAP
jgi:4-diphosphocytidyl-2-C-methyl-D-erythritol kinase